MRPFSYILTVFFLGSVLFHIVLIFFEPLDLLDPELVIPEVSRSGGQEMQIKLMDAEQSEAFLSSQAQDSQNSDSLADSLNVDQEKWGELLERLKNNSNLTSSFKQVFEDFRPDSKTSRSYIYRDRRQEDIVVKEVFPTIHNIDKNFKEILNAAPKELTDHNKRNEIIRDYRKLQQGNLSTKTLKISLTDKNDKAKKSPLHFPAEERKKYFDDTLTLPKEVQLNNFVRRYFSYDPDEGDLPVATRELYYDNLQRIAYIFSSDPTYFYLDYFLENLNKEEFLKNSLYQAASLDGSKTQTELLFAIEDIYHIQQRAWNYYFNFGNLKNKLTEEKKNRLRNETLRRVHERYKDVLKEKGVSQYKDILALYSRKRIEIMDYILEHTPDGYRKNDALFERAFVDWQEGVMANKTEKKLLAIKQWLSITPNTTQTDGNTDFLNRETWEKLMPLLKQYLIGNQAERQMTQTNIQVMLNQRNQSKMVEKQAREERLLWPQ